MNNKAKTYLRQTYPTNLAAIFLSIILFKIKHGTLKLEIFSARTFQFQPKTFIDTNACDLPFILIFLR